jgi:hypothetical protein
MMSQGDKARTHAARGWRTWCVTFGAAYLVALLTACLGRIGMNVLGDGGAVTYTYMSAGHPNLYDQSTLDSLAGAITGEALLGFIFAGGLCLALAVASAMLFAWLNGPSSNLRTGIVAALVTGLATCLVSLVCLVIVVPSCFSALQLSSMSSSGGGMGGVVFSLIVCVTTLVAAASLILDWAVCGYKDHPVAAMLKTVLAALVCGLLVLAVVVQVGNVLALVDLDTAALAGSMWIGTAVNVVIAAVALVLASRATAKKEA